MPFLLPRGWELCCDLISAKYSQHILKSSFGIHSSDSLQCLLPKMCVDRVYFHRLSSQAAFCAKFGISLQTVQVSNLFDRKLLCFFSA